MKNPQERKPYVVVSLVQLDLYWDSFDTYEDALEYVKDNNEKCLIIGPEGIEDHT